MERKRERKETRVKSKMLIRLSSETTPKFREKKNNPLQFKCFFLHFFPAMYFKISVNGRKTSVNG